VVGGQILIVEFGGAAFQVVRLGGRDWGISIIVGLLAFPIGALVRIFPTAPVLRFMIWLKIYDDPNKLPVASPVIEDEKYEYNEAVTKVRDNLSIYANIRGGRLRASSIVAKSRSARLRDADIRLYVCFCLIRDREHVLISPGPRSLRWFLRWWRERSAQVPTGYPIPTLWACPIRHRTRHGRREICSRVKSNYIPIRTRPTLCLRGLGSSRLPRGTMGVNRLGSGWESKGCGSG
jgi:hypothetical protein